MKQKRDKFDDIYKKVKKALDADKTKKGKGSNS